MGLGVRPCILTPHCFLLGIPQASKIQCKFRSLLIFVLQAINARKHGVGDDCLAVSETGILECSVGAYLESGMLFSYSSVKIQF